MGDFHFYQNNVFPLFDSNMTFWALLTTALTCFECHDAFQTGELCRIQAHLSEPDDHLLKCLYLRHDLIHPLRLCVFSVHSCEGRKCHFPRSAPQQLLTYMCSRLVLWSDKLSRALLLTRNSKKSSGVHRNGPLRDA